MAHLVHHLQLTVGTVWKSKAAGDLIRKISILLWRQRFYLEMLSFYCMSLTMNINGFFFLLPKGQFLVLADLLILLLIVLFWRAGHIHRNIELILSTILGNISRSQSEVCLS